MSVNTVSMSTLHGDQTELLELDEQLQLALELCCTSLRKLLRDAINELTETAIWVEGWI